MTTTRRTDPPRVLSGAGLPHQLLDLPRPPDAAYLWGRLPPGPRVGLVGTRWPSPRGFRLAFETARRLAALGMTVVSGGALGIDRAAHLGALRARGATLVVAPLWLGRAYPKENGRLFERLLDCGGGYVTLSAPDAQPISPTFARRNEALVALCDVVLLGEMGVPSGALMAGRFARAGGVPHFVLPWAADILDARGTQAELERGARGYFHAAQLVRLLSGRIFDNPAYWERSAAMLTAHEAALAEKARKQQGRRRGKGPKPAPAGARASARSPGPEGDPIARAIAGGATTLDALVARTGLAAAALQHGVLRLTLQGVVERDAAGLLRIVGEWRE